MAFFSHLKIRISLLALCIYILCVYVCVCVCGHCEGHCWRSRDEFISDVLLWTPSHGRAKAGRPAKQSDGEVPVILELWGMQSTCLLPSLPGSLCPER